MQKTVKNGGRKNGSRTGVSMPYFTAISGIKKGSASVARRRPQSPTCPWLDGQEFRCSIATAQLGSHTTFARDNRVVVGGYERKVIVCIYEFSPITADTIPDAVKCLYCACRSYVGPAA